MQVDSSCSCPLSRERGPDSFGRYVFRVRDSTLVASTYYYFRRTRAVPLVWAAGGRPPGDRRATAGLNPAAVWPSAQRPPARARMRLAIFAVLADRPAAAYAAGRRATAGLNPAAVWPSAQRPPARARMWLAIFAVLADRPAAAYAAGRRATAGLNPAAVWPSAQRPPPRARMWVRFRAEYRPFEAWKETAGRVPASGRGWRRGSGYAILGHSAGAPSTSSSAP